MLCFCFYWIFSYKIKCFYLKSVTYVLIYINLRIRATYDFPEHTIRYDNFSYDVRDFSQNIKCTTWFPSYFLCAHRFAKILATTKNVVFVQIASFRQHRWSAEKLLHCLKGFLQVCWSFLEQWVVVRWYSKRFVR